MRSISFLLILLIPASIFGQKQKTIIKANSNAAYILDGENERLDWNLSPALKPDIYTATKSQKKHVLKFYTDIDSLVISLKPNEHFDFLVITAKGDTCETRIESWQTVNYSGIIPATHDTIPFELTSFNNIMIKCVLNEKDTLNLIFDSGAMGLFLINDAIKTKCSTLNKQYNNNTLQIGNLKWGNLQIYPRLMTGHGADGLFGWDLFDGRIVEIDYEKKYFIVHSELKTPNKDYTRLKMEYVNYLFCIPATIIVKNKKYPGRFLFDTGFERTAMLDTTVTNEQNIFNDLPVIKNVIMHNSKGEKIPVNTVNINELKIGKHTLENIPMQILRTENPANFKTHILGNEVLKRYNSILDFQNNFVYCKPNRFSNLNYSDAQ